MELSDEERQALVARLLRNRQAGKDRRIPRQPREATARMPLSFAQQRIWVLQQVFPDSTGFNLFQGFHLRGPLDRDALAQSIADVVARHEMLRTVFELHDGVPVQRIASDHEVRLRVEDLRALPESLRQSEVARRAREEAQRPWDLAAAPPVRACLWQLADDEHAFVLLMHHVLGDGWSVNIVMRDLFACFEARRAGRAPSLPEPELQYADYAAWQRQFVEGESFATQLSYWRRTMADAPVLRLPATAVDQSAAGVVRPVVLGPELTRKVKALGQAEGTTTFMTLLAAFSTVLSAYTDQDDIVVGSPVASRTRRELEHVVGCFMNPMPFRVNLTGGPTFRELLARVRTMALEAYSNQEVPFDLIVKALQPRRDNALPPLFQVMFLLHNFPWEARSLARSADGPSLQVEGWHPLTANLALEQETQLATDRMFPVALELTETADSIVGMLEYAPEYAAAMAPFIADFTATLDALVDRPDAPIRRLPIARRGTAAPRAVARFDAEPIVVSDVTAAFDAQVARTPAAVGLVDGDVRLTYAELSARVDRLAGYLRARRVGPDVPVGILLGRSIDAIVALLATLKAGGAYVPLDPGLPADRLALMLEHVRVPVVVTREDVLSGSGIDRRVVDGRMVVRLDVDSADIDRAEPITREESEQVHPEQVAYVIYTSGSSGRPKAVAVPRRALSNYAHVARAAFALEPADRVLQFASLNFDTAVEEIFPTLLTGATLVLRSDAMLSSAPAFFAACEDWGITVIDLPTAYWHELTAYVTRANLKVPRALRLVILGGEKALASRVREWLAAAGRGVRLLNTYGPTEATVVATMSDLTDLEPVPEQVPLGVAIPNAYTVVTADGVERVSDGTFGELCIGGDGLARGYLGDPAMTAEKFVPDPFSGRPGARLYRTGDLARLDATGQIEFGGRVDDQVKLRGYRIEPGEIEAVLVQHSSVCEAAVLAREDHAGDKRLVGYVVFFDGSAPAISDLREFLRNRLPDYMVPSAFVVLDKLPRTIQRKVDRAALPAPSESAESSERFVAPQTEVEQKIAAIWSDVLHRERIGIVENFFDLGGHSLLVIQLHARLTEAFGGDLALVDLFRLPTVESQAAHLTSRDAAPAFDAATDRAARQRQAFRRHGQARPATTVVE